MNRMRNVNDLFYIQQAKAGNMQAFAVIVNKYKQLVLTLVCKIITNRDDAEDITQEIFIKVFKSLEQFKEKSTFSTWLYKIAYNTALSEIRKQKIDFISYNANYQSVSEDEEIGEKIEDFEKEEKLFFLEEALKQLPPDERLLITLFYLNEQTIEEISTITNLSFSNVKVKLHRIRKKLAIEINQLMKQ
jgi:RNA polymerase sigma-70 factor (ECF subfamily)